MLNNWRSGLYACAFTAAVPVNAASYVATSATLASIWGTVKAGDTINLVGNFKGASLLNKNFAKTVTINAAKATFADTLKSQNVSNLKIVGGIFGSTGGRTSQNKAIAVYNSSNLFFD